ncbi:carboxymuconolactone decarboxylase family protein [Corynebacterium belfantii]|uniref:carboxymuconolactone decarboxylase family protein n=1 Tax=Corynebacterium belfantii TaxID=2014537 RepID=UPI0018CA9A5E
MRQLPGGFLWPRSGLDLRTRSLVTVGILAAQDRHAELATHIRGARRNGCSFEEIIEAILHAGVYAGMPAAVEGAKIAQGIAQEENNGEA